MRIYGKVLIIYIYIHIIAAVFEAHGGYGPTTRTNKKKQIDAYVPQFTLPLHFSVSTIFYYPLLSSRYSTSTLPYVHFYYKLYFYFDYNCCYIFIF